MAHFTAALVSSWLQEAPDAKAIALLNRLKSTHPDRFSDTHLRTLQRRVQQWRGITAQKNWSTPRLVNPWRTPCNAGISAAWGGPQVAKFR